MNYPLTFGKYLLLERVNVGGMAEVFKAKAFGVEGFERILAIKRILPNMADDDEFINMFVDEARIAVQLSHANIVQIYELGKFENQYYIAMEYVSGKDLRQLLDHHRKKKELLPLPAAAHLISKICEGLDYAHRKTDPTGKPLNLIHRDVSPQNILVSYEGAVKITDFGIAKAEDRASKTQAGVLKGKFGYMSPEQVRGLDIDHRSDIFAVGILFYELVTGKRLFIGESDFSTLEKVRNADVTPPTEHNPDISPELEAVLLKALAKERDERYSWPSELHDDLQQFLIEENTIYNAKRLAAHLQGEFQEDIQLEAKRMEELLHMSVPSNAEALAASENMQHAPVSTDPGDVDMSEKTMIFESGFANLADAPTQVSNDTSQPSWQVISDVSLSVPSEARTGSVVAQSGRPSIVPQPSLIGSTAGPAPGALQQKHVGAILIAAAAFLSLLIVLVVLLTGPGGEVGTIVVTSTPTSKVDVYLDGALIASETPITLREVATGEHTVLGRAAGFADMAYRFDLASGNPAVVNIEMKRVGPARVAANGTVQIVSEPSGASVRIGGIPKGVTPLTLGRQNPAIPIILELSKEGYKTITRTVTFGPGETKKTVRVTLQPVAGRPVGSPGTFRPRPSPSRGQIVVISTPARATVYLGRHKQGTTPLELDDLDLSVSHTIEVNKDGYRPFKKTVRFAGKTEVEVNAVLKVHERRKPPRKEKPKAATKKGPKDKGGGRCSGSGAKISVMPVGESDCKVKIGNTSLGVTPFFGKDAPVGRCEIRVTCPSGKKFKTVKVLRAGSAEKVIIKKNDWQ